MTWSFTDGLMGHRGTSSTPRVVRPLMQSYVVRGIISFDLDGVVCMYLCVHVCVYRVLPN